MLPGFPPPEGADGKSGQRNVIIFGSSVSAPGGTNKSYSFKELLDSGSWFVKSGGRKRKSFYPFLPSSICPMEANLENKNIVVIGLSFYKNSEHTSTCKHKMSNLVQP